MSMSDLFPRDERLFESLCALEVLENGFKAVKRNRGAPGIDQQTIQDFEEHLDEELSQLREELLSWTYEPRPVRRVEIPKSGPNAGVRKLGIPCVRDRVVQSGLKLLLEPILNPHFSEHSYGFRPGKKPTPGGGSGQGIR